MSSQERGGPDGRKGSGKKTKGGKKSSLPAFGFAEDLLKGKAKGSSATPDETAVPDEPAQKKITLPAFGFAEDLLKSVKGESRQSAAPGEAAGRQGAAAGTAEAPAPSPREEERIFTFADSLAAQEEEEKVAPVRLETWMTFSLAGETFALPVDPVHEVLRLSSITRVPHAPFPIRGVTNLRGRVVPVIDLRIRLELPEGEVTRSSRIVVVGSRGRRLGLLVDSVHQVVHLDVDRVQPPPDDVMTVQSDYIRGVYHLEEQLILLLDVDRVLIIRETSGASGAVVGAA